MRGEIKPVVDGKNKSSSLLNYIISFFIYSMVLWVYNITANWVMFPDYTPSWILYGPYAPYAAFEIMAVMGLFKLAQKLGRKKDIRPTIIMLVVMSFIIFGLMDYLGSLIYEAIFGTVPWDFNGRIMNINGRVCCEHLTALTVIEIICVYIVQPFLSGALNKLSNRLRVILALLAVALILTDAVCTFIK